MKVVSEALKFFRSVKLAVILIGIIIFLSLIAALIPQDLPHEEYQKLFVNYPGFVVSLIFGLHLHSFFSSTLFFVPVGLFVINLTLCTVTRIYRQLAYSNSKKRFGPDIIHIGLLVVLIGGLVSLFTRAEDFTWLSKGDRVELPLGHELQVRGIDFLQYNDGRPKDYLTTIVIKDSAGKEREFTIEVNSPLTIGLLSIYQNSFNERFFMGVRPPEGKSINIESGQTLDTGSGLYYFRTCRAVESETGGIISKKYIAIFERIENRRPVEIIEVPIGKPLDGFVLLGTSSIKMTGLSFVKDYGIIPVWIGIILLLIGLCWTYIQKLTEKKDK